MSKPSPAHPFPSLRRLSDAKTMRALAHPVRISLIEVLVMDGPLTATEAAERLGESPTTCSFHLRQLARYGFVEEAGMGPGRNRPWKITSAGMTMDMEGAAPATDLAAQALQRMFRDRHLSRLQAWRDTRATYPKVWRDLASENQYVLWVTPDELEQMEIELAAVLMRYQGRLTDRGSRPEGSRAVEVLQFIFPVDVESLGLPGSPGNPGPS